MFALAVRFDLRPDAGSGFDALVAELLPQVRSAEPGTLLYVCTRDTEKLESVRICFEVYANWEAFEEHERQETRGATRRVVGGSAARASSPSS
jgi:quinol monooxygenase YgiN